MKQFLTVGLALHLVFLLGCHSAKQQQPAINGAWSEPVNGVRMAVFYIQDDLQLIGSPDLTLLLVTQNVSDRPVKMPAIEPEQFVYYKGQRLQVPLGPNLRVSVAAVGDADLPLSSEMSSIGKGMMQQDVRLEPGEIHLDAINIIGKMQYQRMSQQGAQHLAAKRMNWAALDDPGLDGVYELSLVYRPGGFPDEPGDGQGNSQQQSQQFFPNDLVEPIWRDQSIVLPPLKIELKTNEREGAE